MSNICPAPGAGAGGGARGVEWASYTGYHANDAHQGEYGWSDNAYDSIREFDKPEGEEDEVTRQQRLQR